MEKLVLEALDWRLSYATAWDFTAFWTDFTDRSTDKKQFKTLCDEALGRCVKGASPPLPALHRPSTRAQERNEKTQRKIERALLC